MIEITIEDFFKSRILPDTTTISKFKIANKLTNKKIIKKTVTKRVVETPKDATTDIKTILDSLENLAINTYDNNVQNLSKRSREYDIQEKEKRAMEEEFMEFALASSKGDFDVNSSQQGFGDFYNTMMKADVSEKHKKFVLQSKCKICNTVFKEEQYCINCGVSTGVFKLGLSYSDTKEIEMKNINMKNSKKTFLAQIASVQGIDLGTDEITQIRKIFGFEKRDLEVSFVKNKLKEGGYNKYYIAIPTIIHLISGKTLEKIPENALIAIDKIYDKYYDNIGQAKRNIKSTRDNALNAKFLANTILKMIGLHKHANLIDTLKESSIVEQKEIWNELCKIVNWKPLE